MVAVVVDAPLRLAEVPTHDADAPRFADGVALLVTLNCQLYQQFENVFNG
jgi:hypothetical protein